MDIFLSIISFGGLYGHFSIKLPLEWFIQKPRLPKPLDKEGQNEEN